jgi:perosamine synthetase
VTTLDPSPVLLGQPTFGDDEVDAIRAALASGWVAGQGPRGRTLEERFAAMCAVDHAVAVNNCTAGLHLALLAAGVGPGDEVIVSDYTYPATGHSVLYVGATPIFADVRADTATARPEVVESLISPRTKALMIVDALGQPADYDEIEAIAQRHGLVLIEDAACSAGGEYRGRPTGSFGDIAVFSLHARKGITCGEGGVVTTRHASMADKVRKLSCFGMESAFSRQQATDTLPVPVFDELGFNYKLSDILAAVALVQLDRLPDLLARRREARDGYEDLLADVPHLTTPAMLDDRRHVWQTYAVTVEAPIDRGRLAVHLRNNGVQCNIGTYASHVQPVYGTTAPCPVSASLLANHLALPMHANLSRADVERVADVVADGVARQLTDQEESS